MFRIASGFITVLRLLLTALHADLQWLFRGARGHCRKAPELSRQLQRDGLAVLPLFVTPEVADRCLRAIEEFLEATSEQRTRATSEANGPISVPLESGADILVRQSHDGRAPYDTGMIEIVDADSEVTELADIDVERIREAISIVEGEAAKLEHVGVYVNEGVTNTRDYHCDGVDNGHYKAFLYLTDVGDHHGPYSYLRSSHRPSLARYINIFANVARRRPLTDMRTLSSASTSASCFIGTADSGTLLVSNQRGFHRGMPQSPEHRRVLVVWKFTAA